MNEELVQSAVGFLKDPNVTSSPLNKKIEFLQSKGLNEEEIEEALNRANHSTATTVTPSNPPGQSTSQSYSHAPPIDYYNVAPPVPDRTWKDYFIMATATAGVTYGLYQVISKYVIPNIVPPTQSNIDQDKAQIDEEFIKIDKLLEELALEQKEMKQSNEEKLKEIDVVINNVNDFLAKYNKDKLTFDDDLRLMKLEIDNLNNSVEKNLTLTKNNLKDDLTDINEELNSLKNLIKLRTSKEHDRKITPVSSIPSASEILKRSKKENGDKPVTPANTSTAESSPQVTSPVATSPPVSSPAVTGISSVNGSVATSVQPEQASSSTVKFQDVPDTETGISEPVSVGGVTAGGIPQWQLQHKLKEQERQQQQETVVNDTINKVGVPSWQLNA